MIQTRVLKADSAGPDPLVIRQAADILLQGGLMAFPTETVYGLAALADDAAAVERLFLVKERPAHLPLTLQVASSGQIPDLVCEIPEQARRLIEHFMPGPLTIVLKASDRVSSRITARTGKVGIRIPRHPVAIGILRAVGAPLAVTSANRHDRPAPVDAPGVLKQLDGRVELVLDGGPSALGRESTVIDATAEPPVILRAGAISATVIERVVRGA